MGSLFLGSCIKQGKTYLNVVYILITTKEDMRMYRYFEGLVIREGTKGIPAEYVEELFKDAGWSKHTPD